ncbi:hypothetical protein F5148DRAFT_694274 [Russula earlei]|uniref:Uncharacterized protein n=1 Tax=Russula earlei TaxID=71964 RepID=A0ACC0UDL7_9AGAM|nr:hypothetical protein F5148DRAFT_694274 [Russula earlei]
MDSQASLFQPYESVRRFPDHEAPFVFPKIDASTPSHGHFPSSMSLPSPTSFIRSHHRYCLTVGNGKGHDRPWLSLLMSSRSPKSEHLPLFMGKDAISGTVELDLTKPEAIREVKVKLTGETTHHTQETTPFLELSQTLTRQPSGKLTGKFSLPFSFVLPDDVTVDESNWAMVYPLPPKFQEKGIIYIDYKIVVTVRRGLFAVDNSLMTHIVYIPETKAERPSALREQAYLEGKPLAPPSLDPAGWKLLPPLEVVDTLVPNVTVTAHLSIAHPLSFALGTPIPLYFYLHPAQPARIELDAIDVRLVRTLVTRGVTGSVRKLDVARAVFWPAPCSSPHKIKLWGEVIAGRRLLPSFDFTKCSVRYSIVLYPSAFI